MERITFDLFKRLYCCFFIVPLLLGRIESKEYIVGDEDGWNSGSNYQRWSQKYSFSVGDVLEFDYVKGQHNVKEVTENAFRTCDTESSGAVLENYESGDDKVHLTQARKYWFVCDIPNHCRGGMKFGIQVTDANTVAPQPSGVEAKPIPPEHSGVDAKPIPPEHSGVLHVLQMAGWNKGHWSSYVIVACGVLLIIP
ncbi:hypothetical protein MKW94_011663 [Papaver nudicaule]|uniref:Phytocyanin domain-containing protein n=1 Tax=Papaver nudicaule TaxID=74823 RepID=A0AA41V1M0_PAPNU|nr:hypothetical protein [Papaver nudicaule]